MKEFSAKYPIVFGAALVLVSLFAATPIALLLSAVGVAEPLASGIARLVIAAVLIALFRDELSWENAGTGLRWALPALGFVAWNVIYYCVGGAEPVGGVALVGAFVVALSSAILEELIFRGILIPRLRANGESARWSLWASTLLFCLAQLSNALSLTMGEPVSEFTYAFRNKKGRVATAERTYTPQQFYQETVGRQLNGSFIMAMNDPRHEYYKTYEVEYDRHTYDGHNWKYINLPMEDIAQMAISALRDSAKLYSSYDVGKQLDRKRGLNDLNNYDYATLFQTDFPMSKADRITTFDSGSTHAMTLTAVDLDSQGKPRRWKVENSWGSDSGAGGCIIMTDEWFREYMFRLVVDKKYVPDNILKAEQQKPVMLMPEDPLFAPDI